MSKVKLPENGNPIKTSQKLENTEIEFPVTFQLKAVLDATAADDENMKKLSEVFKKLKVSSSYVGNKKSSKGTYVSYNYNITLQSRELLEKLYSDLKNVPGLKFAL
ncbi:MAG: DUF493 domain-containing protein [Bacteroidetes bacterium]|nr:DUF493 domain-containing protein [Bacteroidota bacterium]